MARASLRINRPTHKACQVVLLFAVRQLTAERWRAIHVWHLRVLRDKEGPRQRYSKTTGAQTTHSSIDSRSGSSERFARFRVDLETP